MTAIGKRMRGDMVSYINDYPKVCMSHVGLISEATYRQAFFTEDDIKLIERAKELVDIDSSQNYLEFDLSANTSLFAKPLRSQSTYYFQGYMPNPAWSKRNAVKDEAAFQEIERAAFDCLTMAIDIAIFAYAAKACLDRAKHWEELATNFPPFIPIMQKAKQHDVVACMMSAEKVKPLMLSPHERAAVKYALHWTAIQNLTGGFTPARRPEGYLQLTKSGTTVRRVTFAGNSVEVPFLY